VPGKFQSVDPTQPFALDALKLAEVGGGQVVELALPLEQKEAKCLSLESRCG
jgi:hypothetical protein